MKQIQEDLYDILLASDLLAPVNRLDALIDMLSIDRDVVEILLLALEAIDATIANELVKGVLDSSRNFYVYEDRSVKLLVEQVFQSRLRYEQFIKALILLNETDLIFRFTTARKFRVVDPAAKQLRINSWGKLYIREKELIKQHSLLYAKFANQMKEYILQDKAMYQEVVQLLSRPIHPQEASRIIRLNADLTVKLLS